MVQPVQPGDDGDRDVVDGASGEIDHRVLVRLLAQEAVDQLSLARRLRQKRGVASRDHGQIAHPFQPCVAPDFARAGARIIRFALTGGIDEIAMIGLFEICRDDLVQPLQQGICTGPGVQDLF
ncbi:hypothetical protein CWO89_01225 [Bradyrhizobium sp. Leo170]|nr:hypothetical protein CWO89_01225 [Bradyrhizobium sp. Leo170]